VQIANPFTNPTIVAGYEAWYETSGRRADRLEKALLKRLLAGFSRARTLLEVGCGTGHFTRWFGEQGLQAMGLDLSAPMLAEAVRLGGQLYVQGDALALPFRAEAFDLVALITTLEFVTDPVQVLSEATRVARHGLILGVLNRQSLLAWRRKRETLGETVVARGSLLHAGRIGPSGAAGCCREAGEDRVANDPVAGLAWRVAAAVGWIYWYGSKHG